MPRPPPELENADLKELLNYLVQVVRDECSTAATRYEDVSNRLSGQENTLSQVLIAFNRDSVGIQQVVQEECSLAATRHEDVLTRLSEQEKALKDHVSQFRGVSDSVLVSSSPPLEDVEPLETVIVNASPPPKNSEPLETMECHEPLLESEELCKEPGNSEPPDLQIVEEQKEAEREVQESAEAPTPIEDTPKSKTTGGPIQTMLSARSKLKFGQDQTQAGEEESKQRLLVRVVTSERFEAVVAAVILSSGIVMCFEIQYEGFQVGYDLKYRDYTETKQDIWPAAYYSFIFFDWFFGMIFLAEALLKLGCFGLRYFVDVWNWLDLLVVVTFLIDKGASAFLPIKKSLLQLMRLFRLVRLFRLMETLEGLDALYIMTTAIKGMKRILMWAVALLLVMLTTEALFMTQFLHTYYFHEIASIPKDKERQQKLFEYFGSFTRCLLSMFEMTLANWPPVTRFLAEEVSEWFMLICVIHKLTIGFAVVGVINGVIMQETFQVAATDDMLMMRKKQTQAEALKRKMLKLFEALDNSEDGHLGYEEFQIISHVPEVRSWLASMDIETDDLPSLFELIDHDSNGVIPVEELVSRIPRIKGPARSIDVLALAKHLADGNFTPAHTKARQEASLSQE